MRTLLAVAVSVSLAGCLSTRPVVRSAPAHAESLACAESRTEELSYTIYGHTARGTGFTAEKRTGAGYAGGNVSRDILLVDLAPEERMLRITATAVESRTLPSGRQDHVRSDASPMTVSHADAILKACAR